MKPFQRTAFATAILSAMLLSACGSSDSNDSTTEDEHDHETVQQFVYTDANTTDIMNNELEGEDSETLGQAAAMDGELLLSDDGLTAALITGSSVQFVYSGIEVHDEEEEESEEEEEHAEPSLISAAEMSIDVDVYMTNNHYAWLDSGNTTFLPAAHLAEGEVETEEFVLEGVTQVLPALILDEEHEMVAAFNGSNVTIYEGEEQTELDSFTCDSPEVSVQNGGLAMVQCDGFIRYLVVEEDESTEEAEVHSGSVLDGVDVEDVQVAGTYILAYSEDAVYLVHGHDDHADAEAQDITLESEQTICAAALDYDAEALAVVFSDATGKIIDLTGTNATSSITLTEASDTFSCEDVNLTGGESTFVMTDNSTGYMYIADSHDGAPYHIHTTTQLDAGTEVASAVLMLAKEVAEHDHEEE
ncbi:MAG: hypothetical protein ACPGYX_01805 [Oceanobacter sp.]